MTRPRLATITEVADYLQVPAKTLYSWRSDGKGPTGYRIGRHIRYRWDDIDEWLRKQPAN
ncbi:helix-turn-helix transcriptional regulator [Actinopolyspora halophila]|uniref:helix-turn-helix transcriptional regulator n=1 Tax=Actinopolyspora halophila TaxID=1850 RepID=UPI000369D7C2|nr:helix-turn-helix domain-containing protein [Actinopolyspora halophila]